MRVEEWKKFLEQNLLPPPPKSCQYIGGSSDPAGLLALLDFVAMACCGDGAVKYLKFNEYLYSTPTSECSICLESQAPTVSTPIALLSRSRHLACGHSFHSKCLESWKSSASCPLCRKGNDDATVVRFNHDTVRQALVDRFKEYLQSGMCSTCQYHVFEVKPVLAEHTAEGTTLNFQ